MAELIVMEAKKKSKKKGCISDIEEEVRRLTNKCQAMYDILTSDDGCDTIRLSSDGAWGVAELFEECSSTMDKLFDMADIPRDEVEHLQQISSAIGRIETNESIEKLRTFLTNKLTDLDQLARVS